MSSVLLAQLLLAILEFFLINWIGRHSVSSGYYQISVIQTVEDAPLFNIAFRLFAPAVFLVLSGALWQIAGLGEFTESYWRVTVFYFLVRWAYILATGRALLVRWWNQMFVFSAAVLISIPIAKYIVSDRQALLPSPRALTDQIWIVTIAFLYLTFKRVQIHLSGESAEEMRTAFIREKVATYRVKWRAAIRSIEPSPQLEALAYAIMTYESFNRPPIYQFIERHVFRPFGAAESIGPMQLPTKALLSDEESIAEAVRKLKEFSELARIEYVRDHPNEVRGLLRRERTQIGGLASMPELSDAAMANIPFGGLLPTPQARILRATAAKYNARSDYPRAIVDIIVVIVAEYYPELKHLPFQDYYVRNGYYEGGAA